MNSTRKSVLMRGARGFAALAIGAASAALVSPDFRDFVGAGAFGVVVLAAVPTGLLMLDKLRRSLGDGEKASPASLR